jgi:hypothetical protein
MSEKQIKVIVYNLEDPDQKEFFVGVNGMRVNGPAGKEMDMAESLVEVLENAIIDTTVRNPETNQVEPYRKERFKVIRLGEVTAPAVETAAPEFVCPECGKACANALGLQAHMRSHANKE